MASQSFETDPSQDPVTSNPGDLLLAAPNPVESQPAGGTLTMVFIDLEGSSTMLERLGDAYRDLLHEYHQIVSRASHVRGGHVESSEGDGLFCVFLDPVDAVDAAHEVHLELARRSWPSHERPLCRIGVHTGNAVRTLEGYVGLDVHRAARVGASARGGQVLVTSVTRSLIEVEAARRGWTLTDLGEFRLEGIAKAERIHRVDFVDLAVVSQAPRARPTIVSRLPAVAHPLVGRISDLEGASEMLLRDPVRLVTITGPGGTGKTRLALELADRLAPRFADGVVFIDLSAVTESDRFLPVVGRALGINESSERSIVDALANVIASARMLLILDNMEQLVGAAPDVALILGTLPQVKILVTSRSPLRLSWEHEYPLSPLPVPDRDAESNEIRASDAVALFVERARSVRPDFELTSANDRAVADLTRRLDGLPLAIELAAARMRVFSPQTLVAQLESGLGALERGATDSPERHRTLRAAIEWSHELLNETERAVFRRLAVFSGGWDLESAAAVLADASLDSVQVLNVLEELVAKSLVAFSLDEHGEPRYRLLETLREYSLEMLREAEEEAEYRARHIRWWCAVAASIEGVLPTPEFPPFLDRLDRERLNLREALGWALKSGSHLEEALMICGYLPLYWDTRGYVSEGLGWTRRLLEKTDHQGDTVGRALALSTIGWLGMLAGDPAESEAGLTASDEMWKRLGDERWLARSLAMHGMTTYNLGDYDKAERQFEEAIGLARKVGLDWLVDGWCIYGLAHIAIARNDFGAAQTMLTEAFEFSRAHGLTWGVGHTQLSLGVLAFMMGDIAQATERLSESLTVRQSLRDSRGICDCLGMMALLTSVLGNHRLAAVMLGAAELARQASGHRPVPWLQPLLEQATLSARSVLGSDFDSYFAEGRELTTEQAIQRILAEVGQPVASESSESQVS